MICLCNIVLVDAQYLQGLTENSQVKKVHMNSARLKVASADTAGFPFFDDFSYSLASVLPSPDFWADDHAFVNYSYADTSISLGVATLDAIDNKGSVYAIDAFPAPSDTLTSLPIDISATAGDYVFLSFFYQAGGKGDEPEENDTLVVEFFNAIDTLWQPVWALAGDTNKPFQQVIIPVDDTIKSNAFQFRFRNYTSMSASDVFGGSGALSNVDQWHIDYVQLKTANSDDDMILINDITLVTPLDPILERYTSIPWQHYSYALSTLNDTVNEINIRLTFPDETDDINVSRFHQSIDLSTGNILQEEQGGAGLENPLPPNIVQFFGDYFYSGIVKDASDTRTTAKFRIKSYISESSDIEQYTGNDTVYRDEIFSDYYAYDDGTAEFGFGITGETAFGAELAYRYPTYLKPQFADTLTGIELYFNKAQDAFTDGLEFNVYVWKNNGSKPGDVLYRSDQTYTPDYNNGINEFMRIPLNEPLVVSDTIFVGLKQQTDEFLNIGYDINSSSESSIMIKTDVDWYSPAKTIKSGSLMLRPIFRTKVTLTAASAVHHTPEVQIYPVPTRDVLHIESGHSLTGYVIFDFMGRILRQGHITPEVISVGDLPPGIYFISFTQQHSAACCTQKFIVTR
jgi:hypothetical protein